MYANVCARCGRAISSTRRFQRHMGLPCDQDTVLERRRRALERKNDPTVRPVRRGRKLMMQARSS